MDLELTLHSPVGGDSITYTWPVSGSEGKEGGDEVIDTIRFACAEYKELKELLQHVILQEYDVKSYESIKAVCERYNKAVGPFRQLSSHWKKEKNRPDMALVRHIVQQCYNYAVKDPEQLNHYEPFSPEVYGETSFDLVEQIIATINTWEDGYFIDLGSGVGQVVLQVAAATKCKFCYGIEKADWPAEYAKDMDKQFMRWMSFFGKTHGDFQLEKGDFLEVDIKEKLENASVIFVNNFAFGPLVDHHLKTMFSNVKEGAKIVSSKAFCPLNFRISDRNLGDIGSIMQVQELSPLSGAVSWTSKEFAYYIHTIDRKRLEHYFSQRSKNPRPAVEEPRKDRRGRILAKERDKENTRLHRRGGGDHTYQTAKTLDFDTPSSSNTPISDDSSSAMNVTTTEEDSMIMGPTTRRKWTEYIKRPTPSASGSESTNESSTNSVVTEKSLLWKQRIQQQRKKKTKTLKRLKSGTMQKNDVLKKSKKNVKNKMKKKLRVRRPPASIQAVDVSAAGKGLELSATHADRTRGGKKGKVKPPLLSLDSLNLLHTHTLLSTSGQGVEDGCSKYNDRGMTALPNAPFKASTQKKTVRSLDSMIPAVEQYIDVYRKQLLTYLHYMQSSEYCIEVKRQRDMEMARHKELTQQAAMYEKEISSLQKDSVEYIKKRISELGVEARTPGELLGQHQKMQRQHHDLQTQRSQLQHEIHRLTTEQIQLINAQKYLTEANGISNPLKKNGVVRPVVTQRILQREVIAASINHQQLVQQVNQLEQLIHHLQSINNQLIAASDHPIDCTPTPAVQPAAYTITPHTPISAPVASSTRAAPGRGRSASKGTKRRSGGSPIASAAPQVTTVTPTTSASILATPPTTSTSEKLREQLDMKENLQVYSQTVYNLKTEVTAALTQSLTAAVATSSEGEGVKLEAKFQPPDLSIKGLLEKTKSLPNGAIKHETSSSAVAYSAASTPVSGLAAGDTIKFETREFLNGAKKRKTTPNGVISVARHTQGKGVPGLATTATGKSDTSHSGSSTSTSLSSSPSSIAKITSPQDQPCSPFSAERLSLARDLISFHETPVPSNTSHAALGSAPVTLSTVHSREVFAEAGSMEVKKVDRSFLGGLDRERMHNYSPISRPSSQSSSEGLDLSHCTSSSAIMSRLAQSLASQNGDSIVHSSSHGPFHQSPGLLQVQQHRLGSVPMTVTVDLGSMTGGSLSLRPLLAAPSGQQTSQYTAFTPSGSSSRKAAIPTGSNSNSQLLTSSPLPQRGKAGGRKGSHPVKQAVNNVLLLPADQPQAIFPQQQLKMLLQHESMPSSLPPPPSTTPMTSGMMGSILRSSLTQPQPRPRSLSSSRGQQQPQRRSRSSESQPRLIQTQRTSPQIMAAIANNTSMLAASQGHGQHGVKMISAGGLPYSEGHQSIQVAVMNGGTGPFPSVTLPRPTNQNELHWIVVVPNQGKP